MYIHLYIPFLVLFGSLSCSLYYQTPKKEMWVDFQYIHFSYDDDCRPLFTLIFSKISQSTWKKIQMFGCWIHGEKFVAYVDFVLDSLPSGKSQMQYYRIKCTGSKQGLFSFFHIVVV